MCKVKIEGKDVIWRRPVNQLRTRLTSLPFTMNSDSEPSQSDSTSTTLHTVQPPALQVESVALDKCGCQLERREEDVVL